LRKPRYPDRRRLDFHQLTLPVLLFSSAQSGTGRSAQARDAVPGPSVQPQAGIRDLNVLLPARATLVKLEKLREIPMSRVRTALNRANSWESPPVVEAPTPALTNPSGRKADPAGVSSSKREYAERSWRAAGWTLGRRLAKIADDVSHSASRFFRRRKDPPLLTRSDPPSHDSSPVLQRTPGPKPVSTCAGLTRQGLRCRGIAMANGYCRLHGGSRDANAAPGADTHGEEESAAADALPHRHEGEERVSTEFGA
jgi:Family of unknown function (DUF5763)